MKQVKGLKNNTETIWHLYLIRLKNGTLYTGISTDVERRFGEHKKGKGAKFLRGREELELVFNCPVGDRSSALKIEAAIKKLPKQKKEALISGNLAIDELLTG
ncbi:MAG: GIY-YIG nuclease family protein [Mariprofundaceae bacterium]